MKKLLSFLGALGLTAVGAAGVVSCSTPESYFNQDVNVNFDEGKVSDEGYQKIGSEIIDQYSTLAGIADKNDKLTKDIVKDHKDIDKATKDLNNDTIARDKITDKKNKEYKKADKKVSDDKKAKEAAEKSLENHKNSVLIAVYSSVVDIKDIDELKGFKVDTKGQEYYGTDAVKAIKFASASHKEANYNRMVIAKAFTIKDLASLDKKIDVTVDAKEIPATADAPFIKEELTFNGSDSISLDFTKDQFNGKGLKKSDLKTSHIKVSFPAPAKDESSSAVQTIALEFKMF